MAEHTPDSTSVPCCCKFRGCVAGKRPESRSTEWLWLACVSIEKMRFDFRHTVHFMNPIRVQVFERALGRGMCHRGERWERGERAKGRTHYKIREHSIMSFKLVSAVFLCVLSPEGGCHLLSFRCHFNVRGCPLN